MPRPDVNIDIDRYWSILITTYVHVLEYVAPREHTGTDPLSNQIDTWPHVEVHVILYRVKQPKPRFIMTQTPVIYNPTWKILNPRIPRDDHRPPFLIEILHRVIALFRANQNTSIHKTAAKKKGFFTCFFGTFHGQVCKGERTGNIIRQSQPWTLLLTELCSIVRHSPNDNKRLAFFLFLLLFLYFFFFSFFFFFSVHSSRRVHVTMRTSMYSSRHDTNSFFEFCRERIDVETTIPITALAGQN